MEAFFGRLFQAPTGGLWRRRLLLPISRGVAKRLSAVSTQLSGRCFFATMPAFVSAFGTKALMQFSGRRTASSARPMYSHDHLRR